MPGIEGFRNPFKDEEDFLAPTVLPPDEGQGISEFVNPFERPEAVGVAERPEVGGIGLPESPTGELAREAVPTGPKFEPESRSLLGEIPAAVKTGVAVRMPQMLLQGITGLERFASKDLPTWAYEKMGQMPGLKEALPIEEAQALVAGRQPSLKEGMIQDTLDYLNLLSKRPEYAPSKEMLEQPKGKITLRKSLYSGISEMFPSVAGGVLAAGVGLLTGGTGALPMLASFATGGGLTFGAAEYDQFMREAEEKGISAKEAFPNALASGLVEGVVEGVTDYLGGRLFGVGGKPLTQPLRATIKKMLTEPVKRVVAPSIGNLGLQTGTEMFQEGLETYLRNETGIETGMTPWEASKEAVGPAIVMTLLFGMGTTGFNLSERMDLYRTLRDKDVSVSDRHAAVMDIYNRIKERQSKIQDQDNETAQQYGELADTWLREARARVNQEQPIDIDQTIAGLAAPTAIPTPAPKEHLRMPWQEDILDLAGEKEPEIKEEPIIDLTEEIKEETKPPVPEEPTEPIPQELQKKPEEEKPVIKEEALPPQALDIEEETKGATEDDLKKIIEGLTGKKTEEGPTEEAPGLPPQGTEINPPPLRPVPPALQDLVGRFQQETDQKKKDKLEGEIIRRGGAMEWGLNGFFLANELAEGNVKIDDPNMLTKSGFTPAVKEAVPLEEKKEEAPAPAVEGVKEEEEIAEIPEELTKLPRIVGEKSRYRNEILGLRKDIESGQPGQRRPGAKGEPGAGSYSTSYPFFMQNQGWTKDEVLRAIDKGMAGEKLGVREERIWDAVYKEARNLYSEGIKEAKKTKLEAIPTGDLEVGDRIKVKDEVLTVTEKDDEKIVIKDGQTYELDPFFDTITGRKLEPKKTKEAVPTEEKPEVKEEVVSKEEAPPEPVPKPTYGNKRTFNFGKLGPIDVIFPSDEDAVVYGRYGKYKKGIETGYKTVYTEEQLRQSHAYRDYVKEQAKEALSAGEKTFYPPSVEDFERRTKPTPEQEEKAEEGIAQRLDPVTLSGIFVDLIGQGELNKIQAQEIVAKNLGITRGQLVGDPRFLHKVIDEAIEYAIVQKGRNLISEGGSLEEIFQALRNLYERQPFLGSRTSTSVENQAYSTPVHIGYLAQQMAGVDLSTKTLDTTAGTGMLLTTANPNNVTANEINSDRAKILENQGFTVTSLDALEGPVAQQKSFDAVVLNPPFGAFKFGQGRNVDGFTIKKKEHYIAVMGLKAMKDNGRATIIIGGHNFRDGQMTYTDKVFLNYLYHYYNVVRNIDIPGDLYHRQGTSYDIRMIVIDGRKETPEGVAPGLPEQYQSVDNLEQLVDNTREVQNEHQERISAVAPAGIGGLGGGEKGLGGLGTEGIPTEAGAVGAGLRGEAIGRAGEGEEPGGGRPAGHPGGLAPVVGEAAREGEPAANIRPNEPGRGMAGEEGPISPIPEGITQPGGAQGEVRTEERGQAVNEPEQVQEGIGGAELEGAPGTVRLDEAVQKQTAKELETTLGDLEQQTTQQEQPTDKSPTELLKEAGIEVTQGLEEAMKGLHELFGGGKVLSTGLTLDPDFYRKARPHFKEAWKHFQAAGKNLEEFYAHFYKMFGEKIFPFLNKFVMEMRGVLTGELQVEYESKSKSPLVDDTVIPSNQAESTGRALEKLIAEVGDIDEYVAQQMGYEKLDDLYRALAGDQVDALALALNNIAKGSALIEDDAPGLGKGRVAAAVINWAIRQGAKPIFMTEKANLFSDIWRDMKGIEKQGDFKPFIMASNQNTAKITDDETGQTIFNLLGDKKRKDLLSAIQLKGQEGLGEHNCLVTTYSQINRQNNTQQAVLKALVKDNYIIMDESHNASGDTSTTGAFMMELIKQAKGVIYLSATWAKRPNNIPVYYRTDISKANMTMEELVNAIQNGGVPLQEVISEILTESGQLIRREKIYKDIPIHTETDEANFERDAAISDQMTEVLRDIIDFDSKKVDFINGLQKAVNSGAIDDVFGVPVEGGVVEGGKKVGDTITSANFSAIVHNAVRVLLFTMKADKVANEAIKLLQGDKEKGIESRKPFIAVSNTMERFLDDLVQRGELKVGEPLNINFGHILNKYLRGTLRFRIKPMKGGPGQVHDLPLHSLPEELQEAYQAIESTIKGITETTTLPGSPIDYIKQKIAAAGFQVAEITGRGFMSDLSDPKKPTLRARTEKEKSDRNAIIRGYNNGPIDVLVANAAGAAGMSVHTDPKFKDQRERIFMGVQYELNIDTELQKMGRINRKNQTKRPSYNYYMTALPAEIRPAAVHRKKMKSLLAQTTANPDSALMQKDIPDMINKYGDDIAKKWLEQHPEILHELGYELDSLPPDLMQKVTGRMALQPVSIQKEFFDTIEDEYNLYIQDLKEQGLYDLEVQFNDFKAEPISKEKLISGKDESNAFGQSTYLEEMSVIAPKRPHTREKIQQLIDEHLAGKTTKQYRDAFIKTLEDATETYIEQKRAEFSERAKKRAEKKAPQGVLFEEGEEGEESQAMRIENIPPELTGETPAEEQFDDSKIRDELSDIKYQLQNFVVGNTYQIGEMYGVLLGMKHRYAQGKGSPLALSKIVLEFAVNNALQKFDIAFSRIGGDEDSYRIYEESRGITDMWEALTPSEIREKRWFMTGNLLQGFAKAPKHSLVTRFTTAKGDRLRGVLLPRNYKPDLKNVTVGVNPEEATKIALGGEYLQFEGVILSKTAYRDDWSLVVPSNKQAGGRYFLDATLKELSTKGEFETLNKTFRAHYTKDAIPQLIQRLYELGTSFQVSRDTYNRFFPPAQGPAQARIVKPGEEGYEMPPFVPTEEGAQPKSEQERKAEEYARKYGLEEEEGEEGQLRPATAQVARGQGATMVPGARPSPADINEMTRALQRVLPRGVQFSFVEELWIDTNDPRYEQSILEWLSLNPTAQLPARIRIAGQTKNTMISGQGLMSMIEVALKDFPGETARHTAYHEAWHAIQGMLLDNDEKRIVRDRYKNDEMIADAFAEFVEDRRRLMPASIKRIFEKLRNFIDALGNYLSGRGFRSVNDIFGVAMAGRLRGQPHGPAMAPGAAQRTTLNLPPQITNAQSNNPYVEDEMEKAFGLDHGTILDRAKSLTMQFAHSFTRHFPLLDPKRFGKAADILRRYEQIPEYAKKTAYEELKSITKGFNKDSLKLFSRIHILRDLLRDIEDGLYGPINPLPFKYTNRQEIQNDLAKYEAIMSVNPEILTADNERKRIWGTLRRQLVDAEIIDEGRRDDDRYFHHQVLQYMAIKATGVLSEKRTPYTGLSSADVRLHKKGWQIAREGSAEAFNTNYLEAEFEVMSQAIAQLETIKILDELQKAEDLSGQLKREATRFGLNSREWKQMLKRHPGYVVWQPKKGFQFYMANTIADKYIREVLGQQAFEVYKAIGKVNIPGVGFVDIEQVPVRRTMAVGGRRKEWAIPAELARTLDNFKDFKDEGPVFKAAQFIQTSWKQWTLLNPFRVVKYNINNLSGDADIVMAYNPKILKYSVRAAKDLWIQKTGKGFLSANIAGELDRAFRMGIIGSGITINEIPDINDEGIFKMLTGQKPTLVERYWNTVKDFTNWRENVLRLAAYRFFKEQLRAGNMLYGVSKKEEIDAITDLDQRAAKLARELVGDYGNISQAGQWLRRNMIPFYSWMEINAPRYCRLMRNISYEQRAPAGAAGRVTGVLSKQFLSRGVKTSVQILGLYAMISLWNALVFPDEDEEMKRSGRRELNMILGRRADGSIRSLRIQGALSDALQWFRMEDFPDDIREVLSGKVSWTKKLKEAALGPLERVLQAARPIEKAIGEAAAGKTFYPEMTKPRPIKDKLQHILKTVSLDLPYKYATRLTGEPIPMRGGAAANIIKDLESIATYRIEPGEGAYYTILNKEIDFLREHGEEMPAITPTKKSTILYYYKMAQRYGDKRASQAYMTKYIEAGGTKQDLMRSIKKSHPLAILSIKYRQAFLTSLDDEDRKALETAVDWWQRIYGD